MKLKKFQEGGAMPPAEGGMPQEAAPQEAQGGQDPVAMLAQMAQQALETKDPNAAFAVCEGLLQLIQQITQQGGGEQPAPEGEPVYAKRGAKLTMVKRIKS